MPARSLTAAAMARTFALSAIVGALGVPVVWLAIVLVRARWFADLGQPPRPFDPYLEALGACWFGPFVGVALGLAVGWLRLVMRAGRAGRDGGRAARSHATAPAAAAPAPEPEPAPAIVWVAWGLCGVFAAIGFVIAAGPALFVCVL
ncbi:MAG: hypothetical protein INH34_19650, partial [Phycisphaerales bacterium]|nr:hypothetical protein [Phycisphaerales bacterium]